MVPVLRGEGHSFRAIGGALGVSKSQAVRDGSGVPGGTPERTLGLDGKSYPAQRGVRDKSKPFVIEKPRHRGGSSVCPRS